jgi:hypothetical protein
MQNTNNTTMVKVWTLNCWNGQLTSQEMPRDTAYWAIDHNSQCAARLGGHSQWFGKGSDKFGYHSWDKNNVPTCTQWID